MKLAPRIYPWGQCFNLKSQISNLKSQISNRLTLDALLKVLWKGIVEEAGFLAMLLKNRHEKKELLPIDFSGLSGYYLDNGSGG